MNEVNQFLKRGAIFLEYVLRRAFDEEESDVIRKAGEEDGMWSHLVLSQSLVRTCCTLFHAALPTKGEGKFIKEHYLEDFRQVCVESDNPDWARITPETGKFFAALEFDILAYYSTLLENFDSANTWQSHLKAYFQGIQLTASPRQASKIARRVLAHVWRRAIPWTCQTNT